MAFRYNTPDPELSIKLDNPRHLSPGHLPRYIPGETIIGVVRRTTPGAVPEARVVVTLHGKCTSKIKIKRGNTESRYESSFNCLSAPMEPEVLFSNAPLHIPQGEGITWPFAVTIPSVVEDVRRADQRKHYTLPGGSTFPPPGSFAMYSESIWTTGEQVRASVEYYVQARIELSHVHRGITKKAIHTAKAPFQLRNVNIGPPITDFRLKRHQMTHMIAAYKLVPGIGELTFGQKTRQTFMTTSVPRLTFKLNVILPHTLQIENESPIPIYLSAEPVAGSTTEIINDVPQTIVIKSFMLRLKQQTLVQAEKHSSVTSEAVNLIPNTAIGALGREVSLTVMPRTSGQSEELAQVNLGEMLDFRMRKQGLQPTFKTYNVGRTYNLAWEVEGRIVGEKFKLGYTHQAKVLPGPSPYNEPEFERPAPRPEALPEYLELSEAPPAYSA
ncbi:hypothetical protein BJX65DRAFT_113537 [Aspergillus insuetus]